MYDFRQATIVAFAGAANATIAADDDNTRSSSSNLLAARSKKTEINSEEKNIPQLFSKWSKNDGKRTNIHRKRTKTHNP